MTDEAPPERETDHEPGRRRGFFLALIMLLVGPLALVAAFAEALLQGVWQAVVTGLKWLAKPLEKPLKPCIDWVKKYTGLIMGTLMALVILFILLYGEPI